MGRFFQELSESIRIALEQLRAHKLRSFLTTLGVIIGIVAVTLMGTAINGVDMGVQKSFNMIGQDNFFVGKWPWADVGDDWWRYRNRPDIKSDMAAEFNALITATPNSRLQLAVPSVQRWFTIERGDKNVEDVETSGTLSEYALVSTAEFAEGRFFTTAEAASGANVIVIGASIAEVLFPEGGATGKSVRLRGMRFTVIGVYAPQGKFLGLFSLDEQAVIPLAAQRKLWPGNWNTQIIVRASEGADLELAEDEIIGHMRLIRRLEPEEQNDFEVNRTEIIADTIGPITQNIALAGIFITGLSLFVGAIGIMNITFVSVKERTREIGTRRALGARRRTILMQFLVEAVTLCVIGGLVGLGLAWTLQTGVGLAFPDFPLSFSTELVILAVLVSASTGIFSGLAPAWSASRLDPATALRHE